MTDETIKTDIDQLYRRYQETRDDIPLPIFKSISLAARNASQEDAIHSIVEAAKVASYANDQEKVGKKSSWLTLLGEKLKSGLFNSNLVKPAGVSFACLAMVAVIGPMFLNSTSNQFQEVAHLTDCAQCPNHINNVLTTTRSATLGLSQADAQSRHAAKLGQIQARLKIEVSNNDPLAVDNAIASLKKLDGSVISKELATLINQHSNSERTTVNSLNTAIVSATSNVQITLASEAIFIANISARNALTLNNSEAARVPLERALVALKKLPTPSNLQQSAISKLEQNVSADTLNLKRVIKSLELSAKSLSV